jgi:D-aspartate ligase
VDKRYYTPSPAEDWRAGRIQRENTGREESYIEAVLSICEREKIDTIFPSFDPHVYVFSKNKERFENVGVLIPVPRYEVVLIPLDKYRTIQAAQEVGFPCPKTYLPESEDDLMRIAATAGFPLVVKPKFTAAGRGTSIVTDFKELSEKTRLVRETQGMPMIQEYIPGAERDGFNLLLDKEGELKVSFQVKRWRVFSRADLHPTATESMPPDPQAMHAARLARRLGWWGGTTVQTKIDPRDGVGKLMEINPRLGYRLWLRTELGINEPLMCLKIARGEKVEAMQEYPLRVMLFDPVEDFLGVGIKLLDLLIYKLRTGIQKKAPLDRSNSPMTVKELVQSYKQTYFNVKKKIFNPYFTYFFQDPLVSILWWFQFSTVALRALKQLGR